MSSALENLAGLTPTALLTIFIGLGVIILALFLKWIKQEDSSAGYKKNDKPEKFKPSSAESSGKHSKKEQTSSVKASSKKKLTERENRRNARANEKGFNHSWLLNSYRGHTGSVLNMDFAPNGKYLASCGDEDHSPSSSSTTSDISSSSSESNKENSSPSSECPSPVMQKGLSRRQRKNRNHKQKEQDSPKKDVANHGSVMAESRCNGDPVYSQQFQTKTLEEYTSLPIFGQTLRKYLQKYKLKPEEMTRLGYPVRPAKKPHLVQVHMCQKMEMTSKATRFRLDAQAVEFVPRSESGDSGNGTDVSGNISEEESISSSSSSSNDGYDCHPFQSYKSLPINTKDIHQRICVRCGSFFFTTPKKYITMSSCTYHWGKLRTMFPEGFGPLVYTCCGGVSQSKGCSSASLHVWNGPSEVVVDSSFIQTSGGRRDHSIYSLDCEMSYTVSGLEAVKVSVVDILGRAVYDVYIKPRTEIVDFNTRFSGVTEEIFNANKPRPLTQVQSELQRLINSETVLIGHGLENDLKALRLIHKTIIDTAVIFPHYRGLPYRRSLKELVKTNLHRDIQNSDKGHDSFEDSRACMALVLQRVRRDIEHGAVY